MSNSIPEAFVKQYSANVMHLSQQKGSRLAPWVRRESQKSEMKFFDRLGPVVAQKKIGRHSDTVYQDTPHSRRRVTLEDYVYADLVDEEDKLRIIQSPESEYAQAAMMAMGRAMDDVLIEAALGDAYAGKEGGTAVALPNSQKLACIDDAATTTGVRLNVKTLRAVKKKFNQNEVEEGDLYFAITAEQLDGLLGETETTSSDFNTIKALVQGDIDSFMGFKFVRLERLLSTSANVTYDENNGSIGAGGGTLNAGADRCFAWKRDGLVLSVGKDMTSRVTEMPNKNYANQVYAKMGIGGVRLEEVKVVEVLCDTP